MNIGYLTPEYPHDAVDNSSGGIGTSIYNLTKSLKKLGHNVIIIVYNQLKDEIIESEEATIYKIRNIKLKGLSWWLTKKKIEKLINQSKESLKIDLIEAPDWTGITSFMNINCPIVLKLHGSDSYFCHIEKRHSKWWNRYHEQLALKSANAHISVSKYTAEQTNVIFGTDIDFKIIPNGLNTDMFLPEAKIKSGSGKHILYIGTLIRKKGVLEIPLIFNKVLERIPNAELVMIGVDSFDKISGSSSTYSLMQPLFSKKAKQQYNYLGKVPYHDVSKLLNKADVVIFPSFAEALPLSWLEAMAMKKVIVASNIGWAKEIVDHGIDGFLANPKDHINFADIIVKILDDEVETDIIGERARQKVLDKFSDIEIAKKNVMFYNQVINGKL